jgi:hypothetical protein
VHLAPFVVEGRSLAIAVHARTAADRRYAERFAEDVLGVAHDVLDGETGAGLIIVGREGEPHPVHVLRQFLSMSRDAQLHPEVAALAPTLEALLSDWEQGMGGDAPAVGNGITLKFDAVVDALPIPLEGVVARLYRLAWDADFDGPRVTAALRSLQPSDLDGGDLRAFDWIFYLPPRSATREVAGTVISELLRQSTFNPFQKTALRGAFFVFTPAIRAAIEGARKGMLLMAVLRAQTVYAQGDILAICLAYMKTQLPDFKPNGSTLRARSIEAVRAQISANAAYANDPFVAPVRLGHFDPADYQPFEGEYAEARATTHRFVRLGAAYAWQYLDRPPILFHPAAPRLLVSEAGDMTLEFLLDEKENVTAVEERWVRKRKIVPRQRQSEHPPSAERVKRRRPR